MELSALTAVSPIDGRYGDKADALRPSSPNSACCVFASKSRCAGCKTGQPRRDTGSPLP